ncbi:ninjurin-A-like [Anopheles ziemanni]|uniref:ninjurin-A-like n=1 Tax=Anopheles coustani TaxID=139045 RepID=UPI00265A829D|nr:ninjurin-A-like [Anopheles coustani]XP_058178126.1 ninjurin-A-like [Anopheles ziemanni]
MATNVGKQPAMVNINIEGSPLDSPDVVERETLTVNTGRGRRLNPGNGKKNDGRSRSNSRSPGRRGKRDSEKPRTDAVPLLTAPAEADLPPRKPTVEFDEEDNHDIDGGALDPEAKGKDVENGRRRWWRRNPPPIIPFAQVIDPDGTVHVTEDGHVVPDVNVFQQKKNLAQGMMDLALLSANANQLRYVLETYKRHPFFYVNFTFIVMSIVVQVAVGIMLIWKSRYNIKNENDFYKANQINNFVTIGIFIITIVNVLSSAFAAAEPPAGPPVV